jgi:hypothetical protein
VDRFGGTRLENKGLYELETKVTGSGPMANNKKMDQGASWTVAPAEEEDVEKAVQILFVKL